MMKKCSYYRNFFIEKFFVFFMNFILILFIDNVEVEFFIIILWVYYFLVFYYDYK